MSDNCKHEKAKCQNTRRRDGFRYRRYQCVACGERWSTVELKVDPSAKPIDFARMANRAAARGGEIKGGSER